MFHSAARLLNCYTEHVWARQCRLVSHGLWPVIFFRYMTPIQLDYILKWGQTLFLLCRLSSCWPFKVKRRRLWWSEGFSVIRNISDRQWLNVFDELLTPHLLSSSLCLKKKKGFHTSIFVMWRWAHFRCRQAEAAISILLIVTSFYRAV